MSTYIATGLPGCGMDYVCGCGCGCGRRVCTADETPLCSCDDTPTCDDCHLSDHCAEGVA